MNFSPWPRSHLMSEQQSWEGALWEQDATHGKDSHDLLTGDTDQNTGPTRHICAPGISPASRERCPQGDLSMLCFLPLPCFCSLLPSCQCAVPQILVFLWTRPRETNRPQITQRRKDWTPRLTDHCSFLPRCLLPPGPIPCCGLIGTFLNPPTLNFLL